MSDPLEKAIDVIVRVAKPDKIILFGSQARGDHKAASDHDLLVLKMGVEHKRKLVQKIYLSFKNIGAPVDVIVTDPQEYERLKDDPHLIYNEAARNGRAVYERC